MADALLDAAAAVPADDDIAAMHGASPAPAPTPARAAHGQSRSSGMRRPPAHCTQPLSLSERHHSGDVGRDARTRDHAGAERDAAGPAYSHANARAPPRHKRNNARS